MMMMMMTNEDARAHNFISYGAKKKFMLLGKRTEKEHYELLTQGMFLK